MKIKKIVALMLVFALLLSGCKENTSKNDEEINSGSETSKKAASRISILYSSKDSLDPYTCVTKQNSELSQLLYEPLLVLDNNYDVEYRLAQSVTVSDNLCVIVLKNVKFSDGSVVTPADIVFSFNKAKASTTTGYAKSLKYATFAKATGANTISITLSRKDLYFANMLTFPILKAGSDELKDVDNQSLPPIGAGKYVFNNSTKNLTQNAYYFGEKSVITEIVTVDCPDNEASQQAIIAGMIDLYYTDLTDNIIPKMNGNTADVNQNIMVFLGVNPKNSQLINSYFRQAISAAVNRIAVCESAYFSKASPAIGPFPTIWEPSKGYMSIETTANTETAAKNIELAGYTKKNEDGYYLLKNDNPITLSLLVNSENTSRVSAAEKIADNLKAAGIKVNVKSVTTSQYKSILKSGSYDLYIGEVRIENNMDLGGLVKLNSAAALLNSSAEVTSSSTQATNENISNSSTSNSGDVVADINLTTADAYKGYYNGKYTLQDLITAFTAELPVIPICFKNGLVIYSDDFGSGISPSATDLFHGIQNLK